MYTGRGPVCGMIIRGGGAIGAAGFAGADACICVTFDRGGGGALALWTAAGGIRGGTAIAGGAALILGADGLAAAVGAAGAAGTLGGITTTAGGRCAAATEAGVTIRGAGGGGPGVSLAGLGGTALGAVGTGGAMGVSALASTAGVVTGGLTGGRAGGCSTAPFCCVIARSTSPGREMCERSILVLISSSPCIARKEAFPELDAASARPRRCFRTSSAS